MNIKTIILGVLSLICTHTTTGAEKTFTFSFEKSDYSFSVNNGILSIYPNEKGQFFPGDPTFPALPYTPICILQCVNSNTESYDIELKKELVYSNIDVEAFVRQLLY